MVLKYLNLVEMLVMNLSLPVIVYRHLNLCRLGESTERPTSVLTKTHGCMVTGLCSS